MAKSTSPAALRFRKFKKNTTGMVSLAIFAGFLLISLGAECIANDKPYLVRYNGSLYCPLVHAYSERTFGGELESEADYLDPAVQRLISENGWMLWPPIRFSYDTVKREHGTSFPSPPDRVNVLGTDENGRDVLAIILYGFRLSVAFGFMLTAASSGLGILIGAFLGFYGGKTDLLGQRFMEVWGGFPLLYLLLILSSFTIPSFLTMLGIMLLFSWMGQANLVRMEFLKGRKQLYVLSARALGVPDRIIMFRHILPNTLVSTITFMPFMLGGSITTLTSLDFLGLGLPADYPALGQLLAQGKNHLHAPWIGLSAFGFLALLLTLLLFIGEAVRDAFAPGE